MIFRARPLPIHLAADVNMVLGSVQTMAWHPAEEIR